eukprot:gene2159-4201_t
MEICRELLALQTAKIKTLAYCGDTIRPTSIHIVVPDIYACVEWKKSIKYERNFACNLDTKNSPTKPYIFHGIVKYQKINVPEEKMTENTLVTISSSITMFLCSRFHSLLSQRIPQKLCTTVRLFSGIPYDAADEALQRFIKAAKNNNEREAEQILELPEFLLEDVKEGTDPFGNSPIMLCAQRNWSDACDVLISLNCNVDHQNVFGSTALMCSASQGHLDALKVLLSCERTSIDLCSRFGQTALMKAILSGRLESVNLLLKAGAAIDTKNKQGKSCLELAQERGHQIIIEKIAERLKST